MKKTLALLLALLLALSLVACTKTETKPADTTPSDKPADTTPADKPADETPADTPVEKETIKFAVVGPMTGDGAAMGEQQLRGVTIAVNELNEDPEFPYEIVLDEYDDQGLPNQALIVAQKIATDKDVVCIIGHINSGCSLAALPTYQENKKIEISGTNTNPTMVTRGYENYFRTMNGDDAILNILAQFMLGEFEPKNVGVIYENTDYGTSGAEIVANELKKVGMEPAVSVSYIPTTDRDFSAQITQFKAANCDAIFGVCEYSAGSILLKQCKSLGYTGKIILGSSCYNPALLEIAGDACNGIFTISPWNPDSEINANSREFAKKYRDAGYGEPGEWSAHNYDSVMAFANAIRYNGNKLGDYETMIKALHEMPAFEGCTGTIKFKENGDVDPKVLNLWTVEDVKYVEYVPQKFDFSSVSGA